METNRERRRHRSEHPETALNFQLDACVQDGVAAMVLADGDGQPLATAGDDYCCEQVAGRIVRVAPRIQEFAGTLIGSGQRWDVQMTKFEAAGHELVLCAVGGSAEMRRRQLARGMVAAQRILAA